jgi:hypothetical protein
VLYGSYGAESEDISHLQNKDTSFFVESNLVNDLFGRFGTWNACQLPIRIERIVSNASGQKAETVAPPG